MDAGMRLVDALKVIRDVRRDEVVVTTMGSSREWPKLSDHPLDLVYVPSSMGQAPSLGMGLAIAQPRRRVIVVNGDGCMLMNLGCLVTITAVGPANFVLLVIDNGVYEVTGGQPTAASEVARPGAPAVDFAALAKAAGFRHVHVFSDLPAWSAGAAEILTGSGPVFICLRCDPAKGDVAVRSPGPIRQRLQRFRAALETA